MVAKNIVVMSVLMREIFARHAQNRLLLIGNQTGMRIWAVMSGNMLKIIIFGAIHRMSTKLSLKKFTSDRVLNKSISYLSIVDILVKHQITVKSLEFPLEIAKLRWRTRVMWTMVVNCDPSHHGTHSTRQRRFVLLNQCWDS